MVGSLGGRQIWRVLTCILEAAADHTLRLFPSLAKGNAELLAEILTLADKKIDLERSRKALQARQRRLGSARSAGSA